MTFTTVLQRCKQLAALCSAAPKKFEAIIYFDGPLTKFPRSETNWQFEEHPGGLRIPLLALGGAMPKPDEREVIQRREFRYELSARIWVISRLRGFDHTKIVGEVRPL